MEAFLIHLGTMSIQAAVVIVVVLLLLTECRMWQSRQKCYCM